jgi:transcriptional regulator of acetoin/glycerol metabolism
VVSGLEPAARDVFRRYQWPGNVRQLQNVIERIFLLEDDRRILVKHIPPRLLLELSGDHDALDRLYGGSSPHAPAEPGEAIDFHMEVSKVQRALLAKAFTDTRGNVALAAQRLNLSRHAFRHYWKRLHPSR